MQAHLDSLDLQGDFSAITSLFCYGKGTYRRLSMGVLQVVASAGLLMLSAKLMGQLAELLLKKSEFSPIAFTVACILGLESLNILVYYKGRVAIAFVTNQVALQIRQALFQKLAKLPMTYYDQQALGRTITRLTADVEGIESFFSNTLPRVLAACITVVSVLIAMLLTDFYIGLIIGLSSLPAIIFTILMRKPVRACLRDYKRKSAALNAQLAELINGLPVIKVFGLENWSESTFNKGSRELLSSAFRMMNWNTFIRPMAALLCSLPIVMILWWGGHMAIDQTISIGLLVAFIRYAERYFRPIMQLSFELHLIQDAIASSERVRGMLSEKEESETLKKSGFIKQKISGQVRYENVSMAYATGSPVLKSINFSVGPGMKVALVGKTGSGKSTCLHLLPQLYPLLEGKISIDGIPLEQWDRQALREQIGIVSQDVVLFQGSLRENLLVTQPKSVAVNDAALQAICQRSGLDRILAKLPEGLDHQLQDGGSNLSMGERQLIAFTRILLRSPAILILDEATAHIDEAYEALIQEAILELLKNRTCFIIAHRLSTIRHCDKILVFSEGMIIEEGCHNELMARQGHYANLVKRQISNELI